MIRLPISWLPFLVAALFLVAIFVVWLAYWQRRVVWEQSEGRGCFRCRLCSQPVRAGGRSKLFRCPRCSALNEKLKTERL